EDLLAGLLIRGQARDDLVEGALGVEHHRPQLARQLHALRREHVGLDPPRLARELLQAERGRQPLGRVDGDNGHLLTARRQAERQRGRRRRLADAPCTEADHDALALQARAQLLPPAGCHRGIVVPVQESPGPMRIPHGRLSRNRASEPPWKERPRSSHSPTRRAAWPRRRRRSTWLPPSRRRVIAFCAWTWTRRAT